MEIIGHDNRSDYGKALMPDESWKTSWAIGTTYSLDLEVLMCIPMALFQGKYLSEATDVRNLRADMLNALEQVKGKMFVFVHENNVTANIGFSMLMSFLDQNIYNVELDSAFKNFHPKVWLVRYERGKEYTYRLLVMSRNISNSTDFDIAVRMDSDKCQTDDNKKLVEMVDFLMSKSGRKDIIRQAKRELKEIRFLAPSSFNLYKTMFWTQFRKGETSPLLLESQQFEDILIISPFVDDDSLCRLSRKTTGRKILVSRQSEMDKLNETSLDLFDCYQWNTMLEDAEYYEEDGQNPDKSAKTNRSINLHAKIFIVKAKFGRDMKFWNNWFVGSANCTKAGLHDNYEAMLQLRSDKVETSAESVLEQLVKDNLITKYQKKEIAIDKESDKDKRRMREVIFALSKISFKGEINSIDTNQYVLSLWIDDDKRISLFDNNQDVKIEISPFARKEEKWDLSVSNEHRFVQIPCQWLSPFVRVELNVGSESRAILLRIEVLMPDERHGCVVSEILDSEEKVMRYLLYCLDKQIGDEQQKIGKDMPSHNSSTGDSDSWDSYSLPIYERLLIAASREPETLKVIDSNIQRLKREKGKDGKPLLSLEFMKMWKRFSPFIK